MVKQDIGKEMNGPPDENLIISDKSPPTTQEGRFSHLAFSKERIKSDKEYQASLTLIICGSLLWILGLAACGLSGDYI